MRQLIDDYLMALDPEDYEPPEHHFSLARERARAPRFATLEELEALAWEPEGETVEPTEMIDDEAFYRLERLKEREAARIN